MAFNGSGIFVRIYNWVNDANASIDISATRMDGEDNGFASGLSNAICKDGQTTITQNIPFNGKKITGLGAGTIATDAAQLGQIQSSAAIWLGTSAGTNTVTASATPTLTVYAAGQTFKFIAGGTCTGAVTLNIDSLGAKAVQKLGNALIAGDITANNVPEVVYDGVQFQLLSPVPVASVAQQFVLLGTANASSSSTLDFTSMITSSYERYKLVFKDLICGSTATVLLLAAYDNATFGATITSQVALEVLSGTSAPTYTGTSSTSGAVIVPSNVGATGISGFMEFSISTIGGGGIGAVGRLIATSNYYGGSSEITQADFLIKDSTGGINAMRLKPSAGTFTSGKVQLFGVKNS